MYTYILLSYNITKIHIYYNICYDISFSIIRYTFYNITVRIKEHTDSVMTNLLPNIYYLLFYYFLFIINIFLYLSYISFDIFIIYIHIHI